MSTGYTAAIASATQVSGTIVKMQPSEFMRLVNRIQSPLVLQAYRGGPIGKGHQYLTSYKGFAFFTRSPERLPLPGMAEVVDVKTIWIT